jgi:hypothetical protein
MSAIWWLVSRSWLSDDPSSAREAEAPISATPRIKISAASERIFVVM